MDEKKYYVNFGPELLKLLGPNLYTNIYYVLGELIANAYDADANNVYIQYDSRSNTISVEDDGNGMSYDDFNRKFLPIGVTSRDNGSNTFSESGKRRRMGRKGIGKLAALSVSERVKIMSIKDGEKSGCILSLKMEKQDEKYEIPAIDESDIEIKHTSSEGNGSAIIMENSRYPINKTIESVKRNISLLFPFASDEFKVHVENLETGHTATIDDSAELIVKQSDALITFSNITGSRHKQLSKLHDVFDNDRNYRAYYENGEYPKDLPPKKEFHKEKDAIVKKLELICNTGEKKEYILSIEGWIATYDSIKDKKRNTDFPINYISIISNGKLGKADIIPEISTKRTYESYVVGQFFVDLLEETDLPDISSSNRQSYCETDERYICMKELIREQALKPITNLKQNANNVKDQGKENKKVKALKASKEEYDKAMTEITNDPSFKQVISESVNIQKILKDSWDLKDTLRESYKKLMISHTGCDKEIIDELEKVLHYCGFSEEEIIYTNSEHIESRIAPNYDIYSYLHEFFVDTLKHNDLCVIYVLNKQFSEKWNPTLEAGAGWVLNTRSYPMFTDDISSVKNPFPTRENIPRLNFKLTNIEVQNIAITIIKLCKEAGKHDRDLNAVISFIKGTKLYTD